MRKLVYKLAIPVCALLSLSILAGFSTSEKLQDAHPPIHIKNNGATPNYQNGYQPSQIRTAYGLDKLASTGVGQTIAIVDAYGSPTIRNDLDVFSKQFKLKSANLEIVTQAGSNKTNAGWALETSLDVEWAHAIAPDAKILLVVAKSASISDLLAAEDYATSRGAQVISNSWGGSEFASEANYDSHFKHSGTVYVASSGDNGAGMSWPASSPYVLSVGGTTLNFDLSSGNFSESAWSGSGGGTSSYEPRPAYEESWKSIVGTHRGSPDVSWDADPNTGVAVYDSTPYNGQKGWYQVGGTSFGAPCWAALIALANQGHSTPLTSFDAISQLYSLAGTDVYTKNYNDITAGNNGGYSAQAGYDLVTGLGSPHVNNLIPMLNKSK